MIWDEYFHAICATISNKSPCLSRKIGCIIVKDNRVVSTGYNGPAQGIAHCGVERFERDGLLAEALMKHLGDMDKTSALNLIANKCPRRLMGFESGQGLEWCRAEHAESNAIINAARLGVICQGTSLYLNSVVPCSRCFSKIINAGIIEIVCEEGTFYDSYAEWLWGQTEINIREFEL